MLQQLHSQLQQRFISIFLSVLCVHFQHELSLDSIFLVILSTFIDSFQVRGLRLPSTKQYVIKTKRFRLTLAPLNGFKIPKADGITGPLLLIMKTKPTFRVKEDGLVGLLLIFKVLKLAFHSLLLCV